MLRILLILVLGSTLSGLVAYLGNKLGRQVGRRKMSIFGLRPRHTSNLITVATGSMIFLLTLGVAAAGSSEVRTFLNGIDELIARRDDLERDLKRTTRIRNLGPVFEPGQTMAIGVIECGKPEVPVQEQIDTLLTMANQNAITLSNLKAEQGGFPSTEDDQKVVGYDVEERRKIVQELLSARSGTKLICQLLAGLKQPWYYGDKIESRFMFRPNPRIFRKGEVIVGTRVNGMQPSAKVLGDLNDFIYRDLQFTALQRGMMRNPITTKLDTSIDLVLIRKKSEQIARCNRLMMLRVVANTDIYPLGPLDADLVVSSP